MSDSSRPYRRTVAQPVSFVHGIFLARILEWVAISSSRESSQNSGTEPVSPAVAGGSFTAEPLGKLVGLQESNTITLNVPYLPAVMLKR